MKTLSEIFESVRSTLHWGPSLAPFYEAIIADSAAKDERIAALEQDHATDKAMMDELRAEYSVRSVARAQLAEPKYIEEPAMPVPVEKAAVDALTGQVADDADSLAEHGEQNPAEPVQTPVSDLLDEAQPEPAPAGPDASEGPGDHAAENSAAPTLADDHPVPTE